MWHALPLHCPMQSWQSINQFAAMTREERLAM